MHMADALVSPAVGGAFWAAAAGTIAYCSARVRKDLDDRKVPLMGVLGAFVFAAQMINFTIPATGSSGHLGGGLLLAILLGPSAAYLTIASVLMIQALFFADGGLLALGCNIFNLGVFPAFIAYPLVYKKLVGRDPRQSRMVAASILAAVVALQFGSLGVVMQTVLSGVSALPFDTFLLLMQPIHLGIGVVEGVVTALVVSFIYQARPEIKITGTPELPETEYREHRQLGKLQEETALLPDYALPTEDGGSSSTASERMGTSLSGIIGGAITLVFCSLIGVFLKRRSSAQRKEAQDAGN
jgi:cobalt/nickel transport system permease protein